MERKIRVGIVGIGGQGQEQMEFLSQFNECQVIAVCDSNIEDIILPEKFLLIKKYREYQEMILLEELDVIWIAVPHHCHYEIASFALKNNIHVIKEKPLAVNYEDGKKLIELSRRNKKSIFTLMQRRKHGSYLKVKELLSRTDIGDVNLIKAEYTFNGGPYNYGWRGKKELAGGGAVIDMGYHIIDLMIWYFGLPYNVGALLTNRSRKNTYYETEDSVIISFTTNKGALGNLFLSRATAPKKEEVTIFTSKHVITADRSKVTLSNQDNTVQEEWVYSSSWDESICFQIKEIFNEIETNSITTNDDQLEDLKFCEMIYSSAENKKFTVVN